MSPHAHALDRVPQWNYLWIPNYYPPGTSAARWNRFGAYIEGQERRGLGNLGGKSAPRH